MKNVFHKKFSSIICAIFYKNLHTLLLRKFTIHYFEKSDFSENLYICRIDNRMENR